jgi:hypothetical protein
LWQGLRGKRIYGLSWKVSFTIVSQKNVVFDQFSGYHKIEIHYDSVPEVEPPNKRPRTDNGFCLQPGMEITAVPPSKAVQTPSENQPQPDHQVLLTNGEWSLVSDLEEADAKQPAKIKE